MSSRQASNSGFTLLEALIALSILAIVAAGLVGAVEAHIDRIGRLETRTVASWVAENRLAELRLSHQAAASTTNVVMAGADWRVDVSSVATADPELVRVNISVRAKVSDQPAANLSGFVDLGGRP